MMDNPHGLRQVARTLAHDLNNYVTALDGNLQFLEQFDLPRATINEIAGEMRRTAILIAILSKKLRAIAIEE
jgi:hypothetical protein